MPTIDDALDRIAAGRRRDPLAPVTVIVPTRVAALQLRRRLAQRGPFAGVRFEVISRIAELIAAADLARTARRPLARPIADYAATLVARESRGPLNSVADLPGYARALRQTFRRLRRAGFRHAEDIPAAGHAGQTPEVARLFGRFRELTSAFYDDQDLLETAAASLSAQQNHGLPELGDVYVIPPARQSAGEAAFLDAIRESAGRQAVYQEIEEPAGAPEERFILAPDAASEVRAVVRGVIDALEQGIRHNEIAIFYGADHAYRSLLENAFDSAGIPAASMPGTPLIELAAGRGVLALARLPLADYGRTELFDFLSVAPVRGRIPDAEAGVQVRVSQWQRVAREAGITHGWERWRDALDLFDEECGEALAPESDVSDARRAQAESARQGSEGLRAFVSRLLEQLEPLRQRQPARQFIAAFLALLDEYLYDGAEGLSEVRAEVEQLGTIDAIGGEFDLESFVESLQANLEAASVRQRSFGDGVLIADYRVAAGLRFQRVFICGAYEGAFPALVESEPLLQDEIWSSLRAGHPYVDDLERRLELANEAAARLLAVTDGGTLTWSCPLQAANATRDFYPAAGMVDAVRRRDLTIESASDLRRAPAREWLIRPSSPLAAMLVGPAVDRWENRLREAIAARRDGSSIAGHPLAAAVTLLRARRSGRFGEFDGNLATLGGRAAPSGARLSPTSLEAYATCGFRYFLRSVLRLRGIEEPQDSETIGALERGTLVHKALQIFFTQQKQRGRPEPGERWTPADVEQLLGIFEENYERLRRLGRAGLDVYADIDRRVLRADFRRFLEEDGDFRAETGAVPADFELSVPPAPFEDVMLTGFVDRIDRTPDGRHAFVIDYKTGSARDFEKMSASDFLLGGTRLQLPIYVLAASGAEHVEALYWFISQRGDFRRIAYQETPANRERFEQTLRAILKGLQAGSFPAIPGEENDFYGGFDNCRYCDFDRLCARRRLYELQDKTDDPAMIPWHSVASTASGEVRA